MKIFDFMKYLKQSTRVKKMGIASGLDESLVSRWKSSFLLNLMFGVPVMGLMIYMMVMDSQHGEHGGAMPEEQNVLPGLSILNLAFFLLCTPVQVPALGGPLLWGPTKNFREFSQTNTLMYSRGADRLKLIPPKLYVSMRMV